MAEVWPQAARLAARSSESPSNRHVAADLGTLLQGHGLSDRMEEYRRHALDLCARAAGDALAKAGLRGEDVDLVISVSCTGYLVPSLEALLQPVLGLRPDCVRIPITELGCSGGAAALALAMRHLTGFQSHRVLVIAVELPSLTFQPLDRSIDNLTASSVFGDAAAAVVLSGASAAGGLAIADAGTHLVPGTAAMLGYDLCDGGFHVVLDRKLPRLISAALGDVVRAFMVRSGLARIQFAAVHAGGPRIMDAVEASLGLTGSMLQASRDIFDTYGNTSSVSILMVLERIAEGLGDEPLDGIGIGIGPGLSIEMLRLAWTPPGRTR